MLGKPDRDFLFEKFRQRIVVIGKELLAPQVIQQRGRWERRSKKGRKMPQPAFDFLFQLVRTARRRKIRFKALQVFQLFPERPELLGRRARLFVFL